VLKGIPAQFELTEKGLGILLAWIKRIPHDLATAARAAGYPPEMVLTWYWGGQTPGCPHPLWAELAWEVSQIRAKKAAANHRRVVKAAKGGTKRTETTKPNGDVEVKVEDVLAAEWAVKQIDARLEKSAWATYPGRAVADELLGLAGGSEVPELPEGSD
jgi:hypothetical protein